MLLLNVIFPLTQQKLQLINERVLLCGDESGIDFVLGCLLYSRWLRCR